MRRKADVPCAKSNGHQADGEQGKYKQHSRGCPSGSCGIEVAHNLSADVTQFMLTSAANNLQSAIVSA